MSQRGQGRYDRSRYVSGGSRRGASGQDAERDSFYDDMRISAADPTASRTVSDYSRKNIEERLSGEWSSKGESSQSSSSDKRPGERSYSARLAQNSRKKRRKGLIIGIAAIVAVVVVGVGVAFAYITGIAKNLHQGIGDDLRAALVETDMANEPFYMLLLGTDGSVARDNDPFYGGGYRSDSMILARIDPVEKKATLISIGRDILVNMGENGQQKINAAYALGGPAKAVEVVSELAGVPISHYAQVDFDGFAAMVDALGGVEVDVPMSFDDADSGGSLEAGVQTLNGEQALVLCRMRNAYASVAQKPDEMRAANQRLVLSAIAKKLLGADIATIASTVRAMSEYVTTDLELTDIIGLAQIMRGLNSDTDIYTASVPTTSLVLPDGWYETVNKDEWNEMMKRVKAGEPPLDEAVVDEVTGTVMATAGDGTNTTADKYAAITVKNATDKTGLATQTRAKLMDAGFVNVAVADITDASRYPQTVVVYDEPARVREAEEIVSVIGQGRAMQNDGSYLLLDSDFIVILGEDFVPSA